MAPVFADSANIILTAAPPTPNNPATEDTVTHRRITPLPPHGHPGKGHHKAEKDYWKDRRKAEKRYEKAVREEHKAYRKWARGQYIPREYRTSRYYITDYRAYNLAPPPYGYQYVRPYQDDDNYYLVQVATGLISQIFGR